MKTSGRGPALAPPPTRVMAWSVQNSVGGSRNRLLVAENVTFLVGGSENTLIHWWLRKGGLKIGGWVEVDWWLQNFCSGVRDHLVAYHLAPAITDFISDKNRVCCNYDLEQTLTLLHIE